MKKIALVLLAVAFTASAAQAQIVSSKNSRITVNKQDKPKPAGYNRFSFGLSTNKMKSSDKSLFEFDVDEKDKESMTLKGIDLNYLHGFSVSKRVPLYVEVGGRLTFDTFKSEESESGTGYYYNVKDRYNLLALTIPVNVTYKYAFSNGVYLAPFIGIHFRLNLMAQDKWEEEGTINGDYEKYDGKMSFFKADDYDDDAYFDSDEDPCKRFQFGGQVGLNVGYKAWNLGIAYYFDSPFYKHDTADLKIKSGGIGLTLGFNF